MPTSISVFLKSTLRTVLKVDMASSTTSSHDPSAYSLFLSFFSRWLNISCCLGPEAVARYPT
ncbi:hypothetical protein ACKS0A_05732 [Histoplasma ohiense]